MASKKFYDLRDEALEALDAMEALRIEDEASYLNGIGSSSFRLLEAVVANYVGFSSRAEWCALLDSDPSSRKVLKEKEIEKKKR